MIRFLVRAFGLFFLSSGFVVGLIDGTRSIAADGLDWTSVAAAINWFSVSGTSGLQESISRNIHPLLWDPVLASLMPTPALIILFTMGALMLILAREKVATPIA